MSQNAKPEPLTALPSISDDAAKAWLREIAAARVGQAVNGAGYWSTFSDGENAARVAALIDASRAETEAVRSQLVQNAAALEGLISLAVAERDQARAETEAVRVAAEELGVRLAHQEAAAHEFRSLAAELVEGWQQAAAVAERAKMVGAPEDAEVEALCNRTGYGAVMDAASRLWVKRDPIGAFVCGPCLGTVQQALSRARALGIGGEVAGG